jgi:PAS domain S-box-containing protein
VAGLLVSIVLLLLAAAMALRLTRRLPGGKLGWICIGLGLGAMAGRRSLNLLGQYLDPSHQDLTDIAVDVVSVVISCLMLGGIYALYRSLQQAEHELADSQRQTAESESRYETLFNHLADAVFIHDFQGRLLEANTAFCQRLGYDRENLSSLSLRDIDAPETWSCVAERTALLNHDGQATFELTHLTRDGRTIPSEVICRVVDYGGQPAILSVARDISERKQAEAALALERRRLYALLDGMPFYVYLWAPDYTIPYANREFRERFGSPELAACHEVLRRGEEPCADCPSRVVLNSGQPMEREWAAADGRHYQLFDYPFEDVDGSPLVLKLGLDVSERKRASEERMRLAAAVAQAAESIIITDRHGLVQYINPAGLRLAGLEAEEVLGHPLPAMGGTQADAPLPPELARAMASGETWSGRLRLRRPDGAAYDMEITVSPVKDGKAQTTNFVAVGRDVSREAQLERHLRQAQKMEALGTMAGGIAHDFNNILSVIMGYVELATGVLEPGHPALLELAQVLKASERARGLVRQILAFSRQGAQERRPLELASLVKEALKLLRATLPSTITIAEDLPASRSTVLADPTEIHQLLMNLCSNAAHAMRGREGVLRVELRDLDLDEQAAAMHPGLRPGPYQRILVGDTGAGMSPDVLERIFDPFFTTKSPGEGTGLGLAVVHGVVKSMEGAIAVSSLADKGTTFQVLLPRISSAEQTAVDAGHPITGGSERILVVDDEESLVGVLSRALGRLGYDTRGVHGSSQALAVIAEDPQAFDLMLTDLTMPGLTGLELAREVSRLRSDLPMVLITGYGEEMTPEKARGLGFSEYLLKPVLTRQLAEAVRRALDQAKGNQAAD